MTPEKRYDKTMVDVMIGTREFYAVCDERGLLQSSPIAAFFLTKESDFNKWICEYNEEIHIEGEPHLKKILISSYDILYDILKEKENDRIQVYQYGYIFKDVIAKQDYYTIKKIEKMLSEYSKNGKACILTASSELNSNIIFKPKPCDSHKMMMNDFYLQDIILAPPVDDLQEVFVCDIKASGKELRDAVSNVWEKTFMSAYEIADLLESSIFYYIVREDGESAAFYYGCPIIFTSLDKAEQFFNDNIEVLGFEFKISRLKEYKELEKYFFVRDYPVFFLDQDKHGKSSDIVRLAKQIQTSTTNIYDNRSETTFF